MAKLRVDKIAAPIVKDEFTGSVHFDGTGDYLSVADHSDLDFGTGDFTIEFWAYAKTSALHDGYVGKRNIGSFNNNSWRIAYNNTYDNINLLHADSGGDFTAAAAPAPGQSWSHYAFTRQSGTLRVFKDGVLTTSATGWTYDFSNIYDLLIGANITSDYHLDGYISNLRICKGHAVYTGNFTPPTRELEVHTKAPKGVVFPAADNRTVLLACQDAYNPLTEATGRHTITGAGNLGGVPGQELVTNGDFVTDVSGWTTLNSTTSVSSGQVTITNSGGANGRITSTAFDTVVGARYALKYRAITSGGSYRAEIRESNGAGSEQAFLSTTDYSTETFFFTATHTQHTVVLYSIGADGVATIYDYVSVSAVHPVTDANPGLLRKTNITSTITENTGSVYFDGSGDYFDISKTPFQFLHKLTHAWTVECWFYKTSDAQGTLFDTGGSSSTTIGTVVYVNTGGDVRLRVRQALSGAVVSENNFGAASLHTWHHFALTFDGQVIRTFIDGAIISTVNYSAQSSTDSTQTLKIGVYEYGGTSKGGYFQGYISNFRICKGHAVYTSQFTPPTRELEVHPGPDDDRTVLLCCYDGENIFAEKTGDHIIAAHGDRTSSPTPTATDSPIGSTTVTPGLTREVDPTAGPTFQGGVGFVSQNWLTLPKGTTTERYAGSNSANPAPRGLRASGQVAPNNAITNTVDSVEIATTGNALDFGDLITSKFGAGGIGSPTRGLFCGGGTPTRQSAIDYFTISTRGNGQDFGDITGSTRTLAGATGGNATRGLTFGGATAASTSNVICAITISTTGSATDFGDCTKQNGTAVVCSPTRAVSAGGDSAANGSHINTIDFVTIQSMGNTLDFGDLLSAGSGRGVSSITRGLFSNESTAGKRINYVTIATTGNAVDFGDLISNNASGGCASYSSLTRGCFAGIKTPSTTNTIEYFTIPTLGDALNFGNLSQSVNNGGGLSNGHGGLG